MSRGVGFADAGCLQSFALPWMVRSESLIVSGWVVGEVPHSRASSRDAGLSADDERRSDQGSLTSWGQLSDLNGGNECVGPD